MLALVKSCIFAKPNHHNIHYLTFSITFSSYFDYMTSTVYIVTEATPTPFTNYFIC